MPNQAPPEPATRVLLYRWLLRIAAVASPIFFLHEAVIAFLSHDAADATQWRFFEIYVVSAAFLAVGNVVAWRVLRERATERTAFLHVVVNMLAFGFFVAIGTQIYGVKIAPVLLPVFVFIVVLGAILCDLALALALAVLASAEHAALVVFASKQGMVDDGVLDFLPASSLLLPTIVLPIAWVTRAMLRSEERLRASLAERDEANARLLRAQSSLQKHVAPQLARLLFSDEGARALEHRRRKVTLFFSDVKDFTVSVDALEPEELGRLLNEYIDEMVRIAIAHNGTVAQISGDGLFIIFGAPDFTSDEKHALDAVAMAVAMQKKMAELRTRWFLGGIEHPFHIRCGINTGVTTVGAFGAEGRREYSAVGLQTNIAARLEGACTPGRILISHATWALVHASFPCRELGERDVKGVARPILTYEIDPDEVGAEVGTGVDGAVSQQGATT